MIKIEKLTKIYNSKKRKKVKALDNINLTLPNNGLVFVLGKSGSGKSTLLNLIGGLDSITEGSIIVDGNDISNFSESKFCDYRNTHIGFIFQDYHLIDELTVYDNIVLSLNLRRIEDKEDVLNALKKVDLEDYENRYPTELSGGERQRVAIARAIVKRPRIILADEPTGNLDTNTATSIVELLKELSKECLILIVSHNRNDAYKYGDRIIELAKGNIISDKSKNPSYNDNVVYADNIIYYPHDKVLDEDDVNVINFNMSKENKLVVVNDKYIETKEYSIENNKAKIEKKSLSIIKELLLSLKFLKNKIFNIFFSSFMVSAIMVILALALTIINFDAGKIIEEELSSVGQNYLVLEKKTNENLISQLGDNYVVEVEKTDKARFDVLLDKEVYPLYTITLPITTTNNLYGLKSSIYSNTFYLSESLGTLIINEDFFISKFGSLDDKLIEGEYCSSGIYITDFVADSILNNNPSYKGKTYNDILGIYAVSGWEYGYINGIIETGYKDRYLDLLNKVLAGNKFSVNDFYENEEFISFNNEVYGALGYCFSLNPNFIEEVSVANNNQISHMGKIKINDKVVDVTRMDYVVLDPNNKNNLVNNEIIMNASKYNEIFGTDYTVDTFKDFKPHSISVSEFKLYDVNYSESIVEEELYIRGIANCRGIFFCGEEVFSKFFRQDIFVKGFYINEISNIEEIIDLTNELNFEQKSLTVESIHTMTKAVDVFIPIFELIAIVLCNGIIFILVNFSTKIIKDKMHDIGILKALGTQNKSVGVVFGIQIILIAIVTMLMSTIGYYFFIDLANDVLIASLKELAPSHVVLDLDFLTFKMDVVGFNVLLIIALSLISLVIPMIKIKNIKPVKIIKTKE